MSTYRVDIDGAVREVADLKELRRLVKTGAVAPMDKVSVGGGGWVRVNQMPELQGVLAADLWNAWDDLAEPVEPPVSAPAPARATAPEPETPRFVTPESLKPEFVAPPAAKTRPTAKPDFKNLRRRQAEQIKREREAARKEAAFDPSATLLPPGLQPSTPSAARIGPTPTPTQPVGPSEVTLKEEDEVKGLSVKVRRSKPKAAPGAKKGARQGQKVPRRVVPMPSRKGPAGSPPAASAGAAVSELPEVAVEPLEDVHIEPMGQVIEFPVHERPAAAVAPTGRAARQASPPPKLDPFVRPNHTRPRRSRQNRRPPVIPTRWWLMGSFVVLFAMGVALSVWYVRSLAYWTPMGDSPRVNVQPPDDDANAARVTAPAQTPEVVQEPDADPARTEAERMTRELRDQLNTPMTELDRGIEAWQDGMFLELQRLVSVKTVRVEVVEWTADARPLPSVVNMNFWVNSDGDTSRELAAVALVAGRYIRHYDLQVRQLKVNLLRPNGKPGGAQLDGAQAADFFSNRIDLYELLGIEP